MRQFIRQLLGLSPVEGEQRSLLIDFWRSTLGVFIALRLADILNAITGLYIIPTKLAPDVLGAILPLMQVGAVFAMPISVFTLVFTRHLCAYAVAEDSIRVRGLLRDALVATALTLVVALAITSALTPWLCAILRVPYSAVGYLAVSYGLLAAFTPMAWSALQALKRFGAISTGALIAAPIRLIAMALLLPLWGLSGYFIGQSLPPIIMLAVALVTLAPLLKRSREAPFMAWRNDLKPMARYAAYIAAGVLAAALQGAVITFVIRHNLSNDDSGAYYLISRFAEIATYSGTTLATVLFPYAVEARVRGLSSNTFRTGVMIFILFIGLLLAAILYWALPFAATYLPFLTTYANAEVAAAYLTLITTLNAASTLHFTHTAAHDRFTYLIFVLPLTLLLSGALLLLPLTSLMQMLHLLFATAVLQFVGCIIDTTRMPKA
jgi:O-antigen/teichoic acid export membrane protein